MINPTHIHKALLVYQQKCKRVSPEHNEDHLSRGEMEPIFF